MASAKKIPFPFILDQLSRIEFATKPMFGCHAIYVREKIMLILRNREDHEDANGVWIATSREHHASLKKEIPSLHSVYILSNGKGETEWQMIHVDADDFESSAIRLCEMVLKGDHRIGKIPKKKAAKEKAAGKKVAEGGKKGKTK